MMPAPSPTKNPSRCASKGLLACEGSSLRVESAFIEANPPMPIGVIVASVPPQIIISAAPRSIILKESPIACAEAEQAVAVAEFGPRAPYRIEMCPEARFTIAEGMKNGEILPGPPFSSLPCSRSIMSNPPIPEETYTPTSSRSDSSRFQFADFAVRMANWKRELSDLDEVGVYVSSGIGGFDIIEREHGKLLNGGPGKISPFFIPSSIVNLASGHISIRYGARGPNSATATACSASGG